MEQFYTDLTHHVILTRALAKKPSIDHQEGAIKLHTLWMLNDEEFKLLRDLAVMYKGYPRMLRQHKDEDAHTICVYEVNFWPSYPNSRTRSGFVHVN